MKHNGLMAKKKQSDRHKPNRQVRLRERLVRQLELLVARNETSVTFEANRAVREMLVREGLWPPGEKAG